MPRLPYFAFPNNYYYSNYKYHPHYSYSNIPNEKNTCKTAPSPPHESPKKDKNEEKPFLDLLGIKLYFDDILLISLIFFLYNEGIKDDGLFMALVLLLLS